MDLLIDLIIYLIKQAAKASENRAPGAAKPGMVRPPPLTPQQVEAVQRTLAAQAARTRPAAAAPKARGVARGPASWSQPAVRAAVPPVNQPPVPLITSEPTAPRPRACAPRAIPGLKLPFLLGEVLAPPVTLREEWS
jgi:hypothetical protein